MSKLLDNVCSELQRLPGIGRRTALRLAMHILKMEPAVVDSLSSSIARFRHDVVSKKVRILLLLISPLMLIVYFIIFLLAL
ncbi:MAG: hypothetical protein IKT66_00855, partial [Alistipes sp.]|nr:hypothetical protein [Alistipes sp.]